MAERAGQLFTGVEKLRSTTFYKIFFFFFFCPNIKITLYRIHLIIKCCSFILQKKKKIKFSGQVFSDEAKPEATARQSLWRCY